MFGVLVFAMGAAVGSFLNVLADRVPAHRSIVTPRSYCDSCLKPLTSLDLIPILSFLWLRGRCRHCAAKIPVRLMLVELLTGILFALAFWRYGAGSDLIIVCLALALLMVVGLIDLEHGLILNRIVYPSAAVLIILAPFWTELGLFRPFLGTDDMLSSLYNSLLAGTGAFLFFLIIMLMYPHGMGGGDVKLAGLIGLMVGYPHVLVALWLAVASAALIAVVLLLTHKKSRKDAIPFGPFMAMGTIVALLAGGDVIAQYQELTRQVAEFWV